MVAGGQLTERRKLLSYELHRWLKAKFGTETIPEAVH